MRGKLTFGIWNINSLLARESSKIAVIEGLQDTEKYDIFGVCESWINDNVSTDKIEIKGFSPDPFRSDSQHANIHHRGVVCMYYRESLPIKERKYLTNLDECVVAEINKIFFVLLYRSPNQSAPELDNFVQKLYELVSKLKRENPSTIIWSSDMNARSPLLWDEELTENVAGEKIADFATLNNFEQLVNEPTHYPRDDIATCIDMIFTDNKFAFVDVGVIPSIDPRCKHQIIQGKLNFHVPPLQNTNEKCGNIKNVI